MNLTPPSHCGICFTHEYFDPPIGTNVLEIFACIDHNANNLKADMLKVITNRIRMMRMCKSCQKEFQSFNEGVLYSSSVTGIMDFCSDECAKNYLNSIIK